MEMLKLQEKDSVRLGLYPNLDYRGLYNAIVQLTDVVPLIQYGQNGLYGNQLLVQFCVSYQTLQLDFCHVCLYFCLASCSSLSRVENKT
jgi:hypothetical protein